MAKADGKVVAVIEVDIDIALNFLESQFPDPEIRWGELRSLIAKQKAAEHSVHPTALCAGHSGGSIAKEGICQECGLPIPRIG